ncbi:RNA polymerase sigma factor [Raoultibacter massiliensis]|uniref:RNA polymerase sigma factor n=1 Tax=Raoultibacter massiliensis TaxID=1852371 RepID=UPI003A8E4961
MPHARSYPFQKGTPLLTNEDITAIYHRHVATVYRLCFSFLKTAADAEDAVQCVFMKLIRSDKRFESTEHEKAWLIVCASNHCKDVLKSAARSKAGSMPEDVADESSEADGYDETLEAVLALPEKYKDCLYLHYYEGYKTDEIARMTGRPPSTVRSHLSEARALLKETLGGER